MKQKISVTLEEDTILAILKNKKTTKSEFIEKAARKYLERLKNEA